MTLGELYDQVAFLGFETRLEDEAVRRGFYAALNRGLYEVNLLRPKRARVKFLHAPLPDLLGMRRGFYRRGGEDVVITLPSEAKSFSTVVSGSGCVVLSDGAGETRFPFSAGTGVTTCAGFVTGEGSLSFTDTEGAALSYPVSAVAAYGERSSASVADIPTPGEPYAYAMKPRLPLFSAFCPPALMRGGCEYSGNYAIDGDKILLPETAPAGSYEAICTVGMPVFTEGDDPGRLLPLDDELCRLLPELLASALWLDDSPDKAKYYYSLYQRNFALLRSVLRSGEPARVDCPNRW